MESSPAIRRRLRPYWWTLPGAAVLILLTVAFECTAIDGFAPAFSAVPLDDAWIHFVYARNALETGILHYNPGEPAAGTSSLLWVLLLALPIKLGAYPPVAAKVLGLLAQFGLALLTFFALRKHAFAALGALGAILVCADPIAVFAALSGMEVLPYSLLAFAATLALIQGWYRAAGVLAGLTVIARPDGALLAGLVIVGGLVHVATTYRTSAQLRARLSHAAFWLILPPLLLGLFWAYLNFHATGRFLPASFYVRAGGLAFFTSLPPLTKIFHNLAAVGAFIGQPLQWMLYALGLLWIGWRRDVRLWLLVAFPWLLSILMAEQTLQIIGGTFLGHRYIVPALPFFLFVQLLGAAFVVELLLEKRVLHRTYRKRYLPGIAAVATLLLLVGDPRVAPRHLERQRTEYARACHEIQSMQVTIGKWLATRAAPGARIGTYDAGAIAFFSGRETIDILGLNSPGVAPLSPPVISRLDYLVTFPALSEDIEKPYAQREVFRVEFEKSTAVADKLMAVYRVQAEP